MVAELIKKNRQLQRQVATLMAKAEKSAADKAAERGIRTLQRRVQRALGSKPTRRRPAAAATNGRKRRTTTRRRRAT
jgi:CRP-like cAMP-binding protein